MNGKGKELPPSICSEIYDVLASLLSYLHIDPESSIPPTLRILFFLIGYYDW